MRFPDFKRVIYRDNPLVEVICQLRFPRILKIDTELPSGFQERLNTRYPIVKESTGLRPPQMPEELARSLGFDTTMMNIQRAFDFASEDDTWKVSLTSQFVAVTTTKYTNWSDFKDHLRFVVGAAIAEYAPAFFSRVGLRYRDLIRRSVLKLESTTRWSELLDAAVVGELAFDNAEDSAETVSKELVFRLDGPPEAAKVRLFHGFARYMNEPENCYLIDADFFTESRTESKDVRDAEPTLDNFNREAGRLFRRCITDKLHGAMGPTNAS